MGKSSTRDSEERVLRSGFSTGTAMTAAARAALRCLLSGAAPEVVSVRLPSGILLPVTVHESRVFENQSWASIIKDGGDDPDVTHKAEVRVSLRYFAHTPKAGICVIGGKGIGIVTKPGLPVKVGEPAINPVPREMLSVNLTEELTLTGGTLPPGVSALGRGWSEPETPHIFIPFQEGYGGVRGLILELEVEVPKGEELARRTPNPRLGIVGGISILGTTGLVKPFSHEAYEETIQAALSVAASNGCTQVVLSTGGKSEHYARNMLPGEPVESFIQIADFFSFAVKEARRLGFSGIIHSVFFGKAVKMAQGHPYTHAHKVPLDLNPVARLAEKLGYDASFCRDLSCANTARHALELLTYRKASDVIHGVARQAIEQSRQITRGMLAIRILLFDHEGNLLADLKSE